ncbi:uncharacterized protein TNCV_4551611 [Trichonephila clavipes]|nr:uncharacterized protein TNCV_4551611 [Trichonephila clavipes]
MDELTDEEYFDDDKMTTPSVKDQTGNVEICIPMGEIEVKERYESIDINDDGPNSMEQLPSSASIENKNKKQVDSELPKNCVGKKNQKWSGNQIGQKISRVILLTK